MAVLLSPVGGVAGQFFDNNGNPLTGGKMYSYVAGTTTPQATYTSSAGTVAHSNPIILDAGGRVPGGEIWLTDGLQYKFVLKNANDVLIGTYDNIIGINSNFVNFLTETEVQTATAGQTVFTLTTMQYQPGTNNLTVYVDGVNQIDGATYSYVETSSTVITFTAGLHVGALVKFTTAQTLSTGVTDASLVTYAPPFAGGVDNTVELKLAQTVSVKDFGAVGDGVTDDTVAIQAAIDAISQGVVMFPAGTYITSANIDLKNNVSLYGQNAVITYTASWATYGSFFSGSAVSNVDISGFIFDGLGSWTATPFANPYGGGNSVGFTNNQVAITFSASSANIRVRDCTIKNVARGILLQNSTNVDISNNLFTNLGNNAVEVNRTNYVVFTSNVIRGVYGNLTNAGDTSIASSQYADGIYIFCASQVAVSSNVFEDLIRIGVALEGDAITLTSGVAISGNTFTNLNSCRGTELNCAIWSEYTKTDYSCAATGNTCNNTGATAGTNASYGIEGNRLTISGNLVIGFDVGIDGIEMRAIGNTVENNKFGIQVGEQLFGSTSEITSNRIANNENPGIELYRTKGVIVIKANTLEDNGSASTLSAASGIRVNRLYNDQFVSILGNLFMSSADAGDTTGQLYSVIDIAGGDYITQTNYIQSNTFSFTGTLAAYPSNLAVTPCSFGADNTTIITPNDFLLSQGNISSKIQGALQSNYALDQYPGLNRFLGWSASYPVSGTHQQGDLVNNLNPSAGGSSYLGWVCTTGGSPGTWKGYGLIQT